MAQSTGQSNYKRKEISYFDGLNSQVSSNIAKKEELMHSENVRAATIGTIEKREGSSILGDTIVSTSNLGVFYFNNDSATNTGLYRISTVGAVQSIYYLNTSDVWTKLTGSGTGFSADSDGFDTCVAEGNLYLVNKSVPNRYIDIETGAAVTIATTPSYETNNLYQSPPANLVNYYKNRLYLANYWDESGKGRLWKNSILRSSTPLGIVALVNNDVAAGATAIDVTDNKYIYKGEPLDVYRGYGNAIITSVTVTKVNESNIEVNPIAVDLKAADELWVRLTYSGDKKVFRWVKNSDATGVDVERFDTFKFSSSTDNDDEEIKMMENVGNVMIIGSNSNLGIWNDYTLRMLDLGVGCVSRRGKVKCSGSLFFIHYNGIYQTEGEMPKLISEKVSRYIQGATKAGLEAAAAGKKGRSVFFALGDVTLYNPDGSTEKTLPDLCLEYNITQQNWFLHTNVPATMMATYIASSGDFDRLVMTTTNTNLPVMEFLKRNIYLDDTAEIHMRADTPNMQIGTLFEKFSYPLEIIVEMERGSGLQCFVSLDMGGWYALEGEASKGVSVFKVNRKELNETRPPRCRNIRLSFRQNGKALCKISKVAINYMTSAEEEIQSPDETHPTPYLA